MQKQYKKFITTGCSFTAGVLESINDQTAFVWPHFCVLELGLATDDFLNFALPGGGNSAAISNLVYYLELNPVLSTDTLVGINLTGLERQDTICTANHSRANADPSNLHIKKELRIGWEHTYLPQQLDRGTELTIQNCLAIVQGIVYLESKNIDYFFMLMTDSIYTHAPVWFKQFLHARKSKWVEFNGLISMLEFVKSRKLTTDDGHPTVPGHQEIAKYVLNHIKLHYAETH